mgnify:CR=1 FL=1
MYKFSIGSVNMSNNASADEVAVMLAEFTGDEPNDVLRFLREMKRDSELVIVGEGGSICNVEMA